MSKPQKAVGMADAEEVVNNNNNNNNQSNKLERQRSGHSNNNNTFKLRAEIQELKAKFQQQQATLQAITTSLEAASHGLLSHTSASSAPYFLLAEEGGRQRSRRGSYNNHFQSRGHKFRHQSGPPPFD